MDIQIILFSSIGLFFILNSLIAFLIMVSKKPFIVPATLQYLLISISCIPFFYAIFTITFPEKFPYLLDYQIPILLGVVFVFLFGLIRSLTSFAVIGIGKEALTKNGNLIVDANNVVKIDEKPFQLSENKYMYILHVSGFHFGIKESFKLQIKINQIIKQNLYKINKKSIFFYLISILLALTIIIIFKFIEI